MHIERILNKAMLRPIFAVAGELIFLMQVSHNDSFTQCMAMSCVKETVNVLSQHPHTPNRRLLGVQLSRLKTALPLRAMLLQRFVCLSNSPKLLFSKIDNDDRTLQGCKRRAAGPQLGRPVRQGFATGAHRSVENPSWEVHVHVF
jgi:hypothetical protein